MLKDVLIFHHLGLEDHFHCNGVVRFLIQKKHLNKNIKLFAKKKYSEMVKFMYRDIENLEIVPISNDEKKEEDDVNSHISQNDIVEKIGFEFFLKNKDKKKTIDMLFYEQYNIKYSKRFEFTYWKRDLQSENKLYDRLVKNEDYIFIHDDPQRGFVISDKNVDTNFQIIRNSNQYNIFDYAKILENAREIHVMESSIRCMLEFLNTINASHYLYNFINGPWKSMPFYNEKNEITGSVKNWKIINLNFKRKNFLQKIFKL